MTKLSDFLGDTPSGAVFSPCRTWRYTLWRRWNQGLFAPDTESLVAFIGLNPSTADEKENDPTITRLINRAKVWGFDGMVMLNLFAYCATKPSVMKKAQDPIGEHNNDAIRMIATHSQRVVCCWGSHGTFRERSRNVRSLMPAEVYCLALTKGGEPMHPLYIKSSTKLSPWRDGEHHEKKSASQT